MALTLQEALKRTRNVRMAMIAKEVVTTDELAAVIPVEPINGTRVNYYREGELPDVAWIGNDAALTEESTGKDNQVSVPMRRLGGNMDVDAFADDLTDQSAGAQRQRLIAKKAKSTWREVKAKLIDGGWATGHTLGSTADPFAAITAMDYGPGLDSHRFGPGSIEYDHSGTRWRFRAPGDITYGDWVVASADGSFTLYSHNRSRYIVVTLDVSLATGDGETLLRFTSSTDEFDGVIELCHPSMVVDPVGADGDAFDISMLDRLLSMVKVRSNLAFFANSRIVEEYYAAMRGLGGAAPPTIQLPGYGSPTPTYRGVPLLTNDNVDLNETVGSTTDATSLYLAALDAEEGLGLGAATSGQTGAFDVDADPASQIVMGFRIVDLGERDESDKRRTRVKWYGAPFLRSTLALARRRGVTY